MSLWHISKLVFMLAKCLGTRFFCATDSRWCDYQSSKLKSSPMQLQGIAATLPLLYGPSPSIDSLCHHLGLSLQLNEFEVTDIDRPITVPVVICNTWCR